ncbi:unnamed protein product [Rhizophagus irregularis]|nr:unnamed protein product [Rhizophagus irregularis]
MKYRHCASRRGANKCLIDIHQLIYSVGDLTISNNAVYNNSVTKNSTDQRINLHTLHHHRQLVPGGGAGSNRVNELIDALKQEFDNLQQEAAMYKMQRDDLEHKVQQQTDERDMDPQRIHHSSSSHAAPPPHIPNHTANYRSGQNNIFGAIMSGGQSGHPGGYPGPNGPPQSVPQSGGSSAQSPYLNGSGPAPLSQQQHGPKRQRMEDGPPQNMGLPPNSQQPPSSLYNSNGNATTRSTRSTITKSRRIHESDEFNIADSSEYSEGPQSSGVPSTGNAPPSSGPQSNNATWIPENVPAQLKKEGSDCFNPKVQRVLDVELFHTLDHNSVVCCKICVLDDTSVDKTGDLYIRSVCFSPDGKHLATGAEDKQIRIWDIRSQTISKLFPGHEQDIYSLDFSRDGRFIVSGSVKKIAGVTSVAISPDALYVAAGSLDKIVRVWDTRTGILLERLEGHKDSVYSVAFSPDGKTLVSGSLDKTLKLWDMSHCGRNNSSQKNQAKTTLNGHKDFVLSVAVSPDGRWVVSGSKDRGVQFWDPITAQTQFMLQGHKNSVISVGFKSNGKLFATWLWRLSSKTMAVFMMKCSYDNVILKTEFLKYT